MKYFLTTAIMATITLSEIANAQLGVQVGIGMTTKIIRNTVINDVSANASATAGKTLTTTCGWQCSVQIAQAGMQALQMFIRRDDGVDACKQASDNSAACPNFNTPQGAPTTGPTNSPTTSPVTSNVTTTPLPTRPFTTIPNVRLPGATPGTTTTAARLPTPSSLLPGILAQHPDLKNILNKLKDQGYTLDVDNGLINTPLGPMTSDQLSDPKTMAALGQSPQAMALGTQILKDAGEKLKKDIAKMQQGSEVTGGGGGSLGNNGAPTDDDKAMRDYLAKMMRQPAAEKNNMNGLGVMHNGDMIGIAAGDIFKTIEQRYDKLENENTFLVPQPPK